MFGPIKVWLLIILNYDAAAVQPHMYYSNKDCMEVARVFIRDASRARCVYTTVYVNKGSK